MWTRLVLYHATFGGLSWWVPLHICHADKINARAAFPSCEFSSTDPLGNHCGNAVLDERNSTQMQTIFQIFEYGQADAYNVFFFILQECLFSPSFFRNSLNLSNYTFFTADSLLNALFQLTISFNCIYNHNRSLMHI